MTTRDTRATVLVGRQWHNPNIHMYVIKDEYSEDGDLLMSGEIGIKMSLPDFIHAVVLELGQPLDLLSMAQVQERLMGAANRVVDGMKQETARVM